MNKRYMKLGNGAIFDLDAVQVIARKELNSYVIVLSQCPLTINADGNDVDAIQKILGDVFVVEKKEETMPKSKLEIVD